MLTVTPEERRRLVTERTGAADRLLPQCTPLSSRQVDRAGTQTHAGQWADDRQPDAEPQRDRGKDLHAEDRLEALSAHVVTTGDRVPHQVQGLLNQEKPDYVSG